MHGADRPFTSADHPGYQGSAKTKSAGAEVSTATEILSGSKRVMATLPARDEGAVGNSSGNVVARVTAAALRNDYHEAQRELKTLPAADRAAAQGWLEKADARDAALAVSRQFAAEAMAALAKPSQ